AAGVPVIRGATRADVARATGYVPAQDRLFQMDLLRRVGAGELAALLGPGLVPRDRRIRLHQFRPRARAALAALDPAERGLLEAYAEGVNAGATALRRHPFEYLLLRREPAPWRPEDSLLVAYAQWIDLQGLDDFDEQRNDRLAAALPAAAARLLTAPDPAFEAPLDGSRLPQVPLPDPSEYDLRGLDEALFDRIDKRREAKRRIARATPALAPGSNNFAVAGTRTADGRALLANDMHLRLRVPNIWYRARLVVTGAGLDVTGVTLPGLPAVVAGSNGHIAWGFTNSYGDFQDLVRLERGPGADEYLAPDGPRKLEVAAETIDVAGAAPEILRVKRTIWGPVIGMDGEGRPLALAWTAHQAEATSLSVMRLERAKGLEEAASIAAGAGMPGQNVMIADSTGRIGWVLSGRLPRRAGIDPTRPSDWRRTGTGWLGLRPADESPRILDPALGYAWSANARVVGGEAFARVGDADYAPAARARQIRDRLAALPRANAADLLAIQLDDRADYLARWQPVALKSLRLAGEREAARLVAGWSGHAAVDDPGYRLVREFERSVTRDAFAMIAAPAIARWPTFDWTPPQRFTETAWRLVESRPLHLLDPRFPDWDAWLADVAGRAARALPPECTDLAGCSWGRVNTTRIQHPLSIALPLLARLLDMPAEPLPGDAFVPRVQSPDFGASERFVVSPGREAEGLFHMPGGQSGHPLSPFYRAGYEDWAEGRPAPFLPGPAAHVLRLSPQG
ncbi:MAG TPA: penicillin acylase family protein, partial [Steroidobacteraceae bacterium]|nr:penicillin acylase family protein [Steroidobacteraceae bacterium]